MADEFALDVFVAYCKEDAQVARALTGRLRDEGLRVWPGSRRERARQYQIGGIEGVLDRSRVLVLCMSKAAFNSDWARLEAQTLRFRDPLNFRRDFIPLRLDDAPIPDSIAQFASLDWHTESGRDAFRWNLVLDLCRPPVPPIGNTAPGQMAALRPIRLHQGATTIWAYAVGSGARRVP